MPVLRQIRERFEKERPFEGVRHRGVHARDDGDREPHAHAEGRRRRARAVREQPAVDPGRHRCGARARVRRSPCSPTTASTPTATTATSTRRSTSGRTRCSTTAATWSTRCTPRVTELLDGGQGRLRGDHDRRHPAARDGGRQGAAVPDGRRQRHRHQAHVRQPLRHRPVDARRDLPRDQHAARRQDVRRRRLRLLRQGRRRPRQGHGRRRRRHRDRPDQGAGRDHAGLPGDADERGRAHRRRVRHGDRQPRRAAARSTSR